MAQITLLKSTALQYLLDQISTAISGEASARQSADNAITTELRAGRVWGVSGTASPSGLNVNEHASIAICVHNASATFSMWRPIAAPDPAVEDDSYKLDANGRWWFLIFSSRADLDAINAALEAEETARIAADNAESTARADADALLDDGTWPGDDAVHAMAENGAALVTLSDGTTRGTFIADDVLPGTTFTMLRVDEAADLRSVIPSGFPGDNWYVISIGENGVAAAWDEQGRLRGTHMIEQPVWPGDWIMPLVIDLRGVVVEGYDIRDGSDYAIGISISGWPGDWIIPLETDLTGRIARGYDIRDGSPYPAGEGGGGDSGGSVEFVDPGFSGDAFGAVIDANGVVKFTAIVSPGEILGLEKREGRFFADTQSLAISVLAIGGGDTGSASSIEEHRWHMFDEELEAQDMHTSASGLATAILTKQEREFKARSLMFPIAEVIGSTVEADVLAGAPRRVELMNRLQTAVDNAATLGKTLMVGWIKLDLLGGAPATPEATAREHYGLVGNGMRLEAAEITGQGGAPLLIVNQGFGVREDGTSEVILAEGRLDWAHFSIGFVVPTPLYPFPLVVGTLATLTPDALLMVREIEALAVAEIGAGREWFCPSLEEATLDTSTITARFATLTDLVLHDPVEHGFTITGEATTAVAITNVSVSGSFVTLTLDGVPDGAPVLNYAFGQTGDPGDGYAANRGSLTDSWTAQSLAVSTETLYRYARSGRVTIQ